MPDVTYTADRPNAPAVPCPADASAAVARRLVRAVVASLVGCGALLAGILVLAGRPAWWPGLGGATVVSLLASAASLPVLVYGVRIGCGRPERLAGACFAAAGVRAVVALGGGLVAVKIGQYPKMPTLLLVVPYYFALLAAETGVIATWLWNNPSAATAAAATAKTNRHPTPEPNHA